MVIIKATSNLPPEKVADLYLDIKAQASTGIIVLPNYCELLGVFRDGTIPEDFVLKIVQHKEDARVAELEKELHAALDHIRLTKTCSACKHDLPAHIALYCPDDCQDCIGEACKGICKTCKNCSNWEWRGAHAAD